MNPRTAEELTQHIRSQLAERNHLEIDEIDADENLLTSGLVDSVGMMRLINDVEDLLDLEVPAPGLVPQNFRTIAVMAQYLVGLVGT